jgi:hypothetical protein
MQSSESTTKSSEIWAKSKDGCWFKSAIVDEGIELFWQPRIKKSGNNIVVINDNGDVFSSCPIASASNIPALTSAGIIPIDDVFLEVCGDLFDSFVRAVAFHSVHMVALGYGDSTDDIVDLFSDLKSFSFMNGVSYILRRCDFGIYKDNPFDGLFGRKATIHVDGNKFMAIIEVGEGIYEVELDTDKMKVDFLINSMPI